MPLSWNEIRQRAYEFAHDWSDAHYEKGETQTFYNEFFNVFGVRRKDVGFYEQQVERLGKSKGFIDLFWPGMLIVEQKSAGRDLTRAYDQASEYYLNLPPEVRPHHILVSDFQTFVLRHLDTREHWEFSLADFPQHIHLFGFIAGYVTREYRDQDPVNIQASQLMGELHNELAESNYTGHNLELLLVRLMFCLFADDTGIFEKDSFIRYIDDATRIDGSDLGWHLLALFDVLNTPVEMRQNTLDENLARFPYVNGKLFEEQIRPPAFNSRLRESFYRCCLFDWSQVSPALFGSLFQTVMLPEAQRKKGAHYTSEKNILKVIHPLFLDELSSEFEKCRGSRARLEEFHKKLGTQHFFDPACGCGNFLILAYRELRELELRVLRELYPEGSRVLDVATLSRVNVDQFHGIELEEFPVRIAETAMWLTDHKMNMKLSEEFGQYYSRLPLTKAAHIVHGNALVLDWHKVLPPDQCAFLLGNPPFVGSKFMTEQQRAEIVAIFEGVRNNGILDYVCGWYGKAAHYIRGTRIRVGFVSTNSITQGEQVAPLWDYLLQKCGVKIHFAHRTFKWTIDAKKTRSMHVAAVFVVIVGFGVFDIGAKKLFEYEQVTSEPTEVIVSNINPYLVEGADLTIPSRSLPICKVPQIKIGNKPIDGGYYLFTPEEKADFLKLEPRAEQFFHRWIGSEEFINNIERWCLWLGEVPPGELQQMPHVMKRIALVQNYRLNSKSTPTNILANLPTRFHVENIPRGDFLVIPEVSSERREYIPVGYLRYPSLASNKVRVLDDATHFHFGVLVSSVHMSWMRYVTGRLKNDYQYSIKIVYNNFPWPEPNEQQTKSIEECAQAVLDARAAWPESTLADLYDPLTMPANLRAAHKALDRAVEKAYRPQPFPSERARVEYLFERYRQLTAPLSEPVRKKRGRG